jgi:phage FluMu protein Com
MPIRFRCVYCDKLLGIARRKAGSVVNCPQCKQPLIVPTPEPEPEPTAATAGPSGPPPVPASLFERDDFDELLQGGATIRTSDESRRRKRSKSSRSAQLPARPQPVERDLPAPPPLPTPQLHPPLAQPAGIMLTTGKMILLIVVVLMLIVVAFGGGIVVGRMLNTA